MNILTKLFGSPVPKIKTVGYTPKSEQEAWIAIMYASMYIDGHIDESEIKKMFELVEKQSLFKWKNITDYYQPALLAHRKLGSYPIIDCCAPIVHADHKAPLFEIIMQLLLANGELLQTEKEIAEYLTTALKLDIPIAKKIVDDLLAKYE